MKNELSKKTGKIIAKKLKKDIEKITQKTITQESSKLKEEKQKTKLLLKLIYIIGIFGPILASLQAIKIFADQTAAGVSLLYWGAYLAVAAAWFGYGFYYKNKAIMFVYALWIVIEIIILNGIYIYG